MMRHGGRYLSLPLSQGPGILTVKSLTGGLHGGWKSFLGYHACFYYNLSEVMLKWGWYRSVHTSWIFWVKHIYLGSLSAHIPVSMQIYGFWAPVSKWDTSTCIYLCKPSRDALIFIYIKCNNLNQHNLRCDGRINFTEHDWDFLKTEYLFQQSQKLQLLERSTCYLALEYWNTCQRFNSELLYRSPWIHWHCKHLFEIHTSCKNIPDCYASYFFTWLIT